MSDAWAIERLESRLDGFALGPVDLTVGRGHAVAVLGPSGAGKTTLLRTLAGFLPCRSGRILCDGVDLAAWPPEARGLGYVPQGLGLLPHRTVEANVRYPLEVRGRTDAAARTRDLLVRFDLDRLARRYPARLSGGERQRVAIARALAAEPRLLVWDEPWQGLDVIARHELGAALHDLRSTEGLPLVVVTHDPALAFSVADRFLVLRAGRAAPPCDAAALLAAPSDAFAARFVGFENVFGPEELAGGAPGGLRAFLRARAGPNGVAFAAPPPLAGAPGPGPCVGRVESRRPGPHGLALEVRIDGRLVTLRLPDARTGPLPELGALVGFAAEAATYRALGGSP